MNDCFYILPLMVLGFSDAFDRFSRGNIYKLPEYSHTLIDSAPRSGITEGVRSRAMVKPLKNIRFYCGLNNRDNSSHRGILRRKSSGSVSEAHYNFKDPSNWIASLSSPKLKDHDSIINGYSFDNKRRFFWEPIFDGNVIGSIGSLFSDKIKEEADREREERKKIREEKLLAKYTRMLNDPKQLAELEQQSKNSPSYINQMIRRSSLPRFNKPIRKNFRKKNFTRRKRFLSNERIRGQDNDDHRDDDRYLMLKTISGKFKNPFELQMQKNRDILSHKNRRMPMDSLRQRTLLLGNNDNWH